MTGLLLYDRIDLTKAKDLHDFLAHRSSAIEDHIEVSPIKSVAPRKSDLIAFVFDCSSQQQYDLSVVKYPRRPA